MPALGAYVRTTPRPPNHVAQHPWHGVFFADDETEEDIASWLAEQVRGRGGNVQSVVDDLVTGSPAGWSSLFEGEALEDDDAIPVGPDALEDSTFAFVFDVDGRRLDVFATHADAGGELMGSLRFNQAGVAAPWTLEHPLPPRLAPPVAPGWEGSKPFSDSQSRREFREALFQAFESRGLDPRASINALSLHLGGQWRTAAGASCVLLPPDDVSAFWEVRLSGVDVRYPVPGHRQDVFAAPGELLLFAAGSARPVEVPVDFDALAGHLGGGPDAEAVVASLRDTSTETAWIFDVLDLLRGELVPEGDQPPGAE